MRGSVRDPKITGWSPEADTIAQPTNGCANSNVYNANSDPTTSLCSTHPTVSGSLGTRWVNLLPIRTTTIDRISTPKVMCTATSAAYEPTEFTITKPTNNAVKTPTAVSQCRIRVRTG